MKTFRDSAGFTRAVAVERGEEDGDQAEVIDLVHLPVGSRPMPFAGLEYDEVPRCRSLDCGSYNDCLSFAARLTWPSFHCRQCPRYSLAPLPARAAGDARPDGSGAAIIRLK